MRQAIKKLESRYGFVPIIADAGIKIPDAEGENMAKPGNITKALALGAQTVVMGSLEAMERRSAVRYRIDKIKIKVPEGKVIKVPYRGSGYDFLPQLIAGVKQSLQKQGFKNIKELQERADIRPI